MCPQNSLNKRGNLVALKADRQLKRACGSPDAMVQPALHYTVRVNRTTATCRDKNCQLCDQIETVKLVAYLISELPTANLRVSCMYREYCRGCVVYISDSGDGHLSDWWFLLHIQVRHKPQVDQEGL